MSNANVVHAAASFYPPSEYLNRGVSYQKARRSDTHLVQRIPIEQVRSMSMNQRATSYPRHGSNRQITHPRIERPRDSDSQSRPAHKALPKITYFHPVLLIQRDRGFPLTPEEQAFLRRETFFTMKMNNPRHGTWSINRSMYRYRQIGLGLT